MKEEIDNLNKAVADLSRAINQSNIDYACDLKKDIYIQTNAKNNGVIVYSVYRNESGKDEDFECQRTLIQSFLDSLPYSMDVSGRGKTANVCTLEFINSLESDIKTLKEMVDKGELDHIEEAT